MPHYAKSEVVHLTDPKEIVKNGYNLISHAYRPDKLDETSESYLEYKDWTDSLSHVLKPGSVVLYAGCGCGIPITKLLSLSHEVTGVDISPVQIERARALVPHAKFICTDMCELDFEVNSFDAIACLYAIIHVPVAEQPSLIERMCRWLRPGGYFLVSVGRGNWTGQEQNWLGVEGGDMYWSHADRDTYLSWFSAQGLRVEWERFIPEGDGGHPLFFLKK